MYSSTQKVEIATDIKKYLIVMVLLTTRPGLGITPRIAYKILICVFYLGTLSIIGEKELSARFPCPYICFKILQHELKLFW